MSDKLSNSALLEGDAQSLNTLIHKHIDLVYATARRHVSDADAHDIVQTVFILFSQRAGRLGSNVSVVGWLYRTTRFCCLNFKKMESRRRKHEHEIAMISSYQSSKTSDEATLLLDAGLSRLCETERVAILLHYLQDKTFAEAGQELSISENSARKRAHRGLEKLKSYFAQRGCPGIPVATIFAAHAAVKAPATLVGLAITAAQQPAVSTGAALAHAVSRVIFWSKMKLAAVLALIVVTLGAGGILIMQRPGDSALASNTPGANQPLSPAISLPANDDKNITGFIAKADLPTDVPDVQWKFKSDVGLSNPLVADHKVYFADDVGQVFCLNAADGSPVWKHKDTQRISATLAVDKDHVYYGSPNGITALRKGNGNLVWQFPIAQGADEATPLPIGGRLFASGYDGNAYALDPDTGQVLWKHNFAVDAPPDQPGFRGTQARFDNRVIARPNGSSSDGELFIQCIFDQSRVIALDCTTGQRRWTFQAHGWVEASPTIVNDRVFIVSQDQYLYCLDRNTGKQLWKFRAPTWLAARPAVHDGIVFLPAHSGRLFQISEQTGKQIQIFQTPNMADRSLIGSFPIITNHILYFAMGCGQLYAVGIEKSDLRWKFRPSNDSELFTNPATDGIRIFVTSRQTLKKAGENAIIAIGEKL
jgi:eukaryotic-like serine/threonine-protein kinase